MAKPTQAGSSSRPTPSSPDFPGPQSTTMPKLWTWNEPRAGARVVRPHLAVPVLLVVQAMHPLSRPTRFEPTSAMSIRPAATASIPTDPIRSRSLPVSILPTAPTRVIRTTRLRTVGRPVGLVSSPAERARGRRPYDAPTAALAKICVPPANAKRPDSVRLKRLTTAHSPRPWIFIRPYLPPRFPQSTTTLTSQVSRETWPLPST